MKEVMDNLHRFANKYGVMLETRGECGFGRPCVGLISKSGNYLDYNPYDCSNNYQPFPEFYDDRFNKQKTDNAYHKHDCMAVLVHNDDYEAGLRELNEWITKLENAGELEVVEYRTGATGMQALLSGVFGYTLKFKEG